MTDYGDFLRRHRRLALLRHLEACPDYTSNAAILQSVLNGLGITSTRDQVVTELTWLREQGFIAVEDLGTVVIAAASTRGVEIARGLTSHPEIERPSPRPRL
ncbi:VpaChn25_0724 family phage protein [Frigidibacter oleivorans]|uniref:VpaChn25_0724 family phage protein n=1 Tax=Frigidibacter oleivorans TaxID=2487129 RepID=UPI000F8D8858|nr:hypothetical protein [Frigidibacter oleivorans]